MLLNNAFYVETMTSSDVKCGRWTLGASLSLMMVASGSVSGSEAAADGQMCQSRATRINQTPPLVNRQRAEIRAVVRQTRLKEPEAQLERNKQTKKKARLVEFSLKSVTSLFQNSANGTRTNKKEEEVKTRTGSTSRR